MNYTHVKITNLTKRMQVFQLTHACADSSFRAHSENTRRLSYDPDGKISSVKVRLRHGPVLRLPAGATSQILPSAVLREAPIKDALKARPSKIKFEYISGDKVASKAADHPDAETNSAEYAAYDKPNEQEDSKQTSRKPRRGK